MSQLITIKLISAGPMSQLFEITDSFGKIIADNVSRDTLINGISYLVDDNVTFIIIISKGSCKIKKTIPIGIITSEEIANAKFTETKTACLWRHLTNVNDKYNNFYGIIYPYIIEYPFAYQYHNEILQNVKDYTKVYRYMQDDTGVFSYNDKVEVDNIWFNKAVVYNGQQSSGVLELVPKPLNNLSKYLSYPIYNSDSKTIIYTKSDNFYQYNTFWSMVKDKSVPLFITTCDNLSLDKIVNTTNMDYGTRSFKKEPLRAKELKVRHILDNRSDINLVSQFIYTPSQISYK